MLSEIELTNFFYKTLRGKLYLKYYIFNTNKFEDGEKLYKFKHELSGGKKPSKKTFQTGH